jgi:hypothetical protein
MKTKWLNSLTSLELPLNISIEIKKEKKIKGAPNRDNLL